MASRLEKGVMVNYFSRERHFAANYFLFVPKDRIPLHLYHESHNQDRAWG